MMINNDEQADEGLSWRMASTHTHYYTSRYELVGRRSSGVYCLALAKEIIFLTPHTLTNQEIISLTHSHSHTLTIYDIIIIYYFIYLIQKAKNSFLAARQLGVVGSRLGPRRQLSHDPAIAQAAQGDGGDGGALAKRTPSPANRRLAHEQVHILCCRLSEPAERTRGASGLYLSQPYIRQLS
jgi:hypothetical protein